MNKMDKFAYDYAFTVAHQRTYEHSIAWIVPARGHHRHKLSALRGKLVRLPFGARRDLRNALALLNSTLPAVCVGALCLLAAYFGVATHVLFLFGLVLVLVGGTVPAMLIVAAFIRVGFIRALEKYDPR